MRSKFVMYELIHMFYYRSEPSVGLYHLLLEEKIKRQEQQIFQMALEIKQVGKSKGSVITT